MTDYLQLAGKRILVTGFANKKSVAWHVAKTLRELGARVLFSVRSEARREALAKLLEGGATGTTGGGKNAEIFLCDVEDERQIAALAESVAGALAGEPLDGLVHSIAFANYAAGARPFHETRREDFLQATAVSAFSLVELARAFKPHFAPDASVVALGISSQVTAASYGYMSPVKAALESITRFLAKSFSTGATGAAGSATVRFNTVNAGPLKTSASAGIPNYLENYLFAEALTFRRRALTTQEVADAVVWLISPRSSGMNAQGLTVDAGMGWNYFDERVVRAATRP
ncbi:MAG: SDR family oxidoreductase [Puniceicoccales bacterium]|jgi:enoyl-[acyl-carrier protein] reductase I|nr:SDR family oxidoreductase [Puniceicoccales bacterium]